MAMLGDRDIGTTSGVGMGSGFVHQSQMEIEMHEREKLRTVSRRLPCAYFLRSEVSQLMDDQVKSCGQLFPGDLTWRPGNTGGTLAEAHLSVSVQQPVSSAIPP